jgi:hypothetical protein
MRLSPELVSFFERFAKTPEAGLIRKALKEELDESHVKMRTLEGAEMHRAQGRAALLDTLIANFSAKLVLVQPTTRLAPGSRRVSEDVWG